MREREIMDKIYPTYWTQSTSNPETQDHFALMSGFTYMVTLLKP